MRDFVRRALTENGALKAVALILAVTLFILVRGDKETERFIRLGVAYVKPEDKQLVGSLPATVEVRVKGPWTRIKRLDPAELETVLVDLSKAPEGEFSIDEDLIGLPPGLRVASMKPSKILVEYEREAEVPIRAVVDGTPADGFAKLDQHPVQPRAVTVRGPKAIISTLHELRTEPISVELKREAFTTRARLAPLPAGVTFVGPAVEEVTVDVRLVEEAQTRRLNALSVKIRPSAGVSPGDRLTSTKLTPDTVEVVLRAPPARMAKVDLTAITAHVELHAEDLVVPQPRQAVVVIEGVPEGVAVEVYPTRVTLSPASPPGNRP